KNMSFQWYIKLLGVSYIIGSNMSFISDLFQALIHQDFKTLSNPEFLWAIYSILFVTILLENGLLPAAFLPGDSLLLLSGALAAQGSLHFFVTILILSLA